MIADEPGSRESALRAAVRETREEAGLDLDDDTARRDLALDHAQTAPQRFDTWFFLGVVDTTREVVVVRQPRSSAIAGSRPAARCSPTRSGEIQPAPPTFATVHVAAEPTRARARHREALRREPILTFRPRIHRSAAGTCMLYPGDAGYETGDPELPGARHRIHALASGWRYERSG